MSGNYGTEANRLTPALVIYLIDVSGSMGDAFESGTKIDYVNKALAGSLRRMTQRATRGTTVSPRYRLAMAAYSDQSLDMLGGIETIDAVVNRGNPILSPTNSTDTYAAFAWARDLLSREMPNLMGKPAPMVCHLTDGQFTTADPEPLAREIMQMANDDGNVLVENIYLGPDLTKLPIGAVDNWPGLMDVTELKNDYAKKLFQMSSPLPSAYAETINREGYSLRPGCRMLIPGSNSELVELAFAMAGATKVG